MGNNLEKVNIYQELEKSKAEWELALKQFEYITDTDAIDAAAYKILATERKYIYLLQQIEQLELQEKSEV